MKTVTIAAPLCAATRQMLTGIVRKQLEPYQFKLGSVDAEQIKEGGKPLYWHIKVDFSDDAANWGEYVLLRFGYSRVGRCLEPDNEKWAGRHLIQAGGWYESGCKDRPKNVPAGTLPNANPPPSWQSMRDGEPTKRSPQRRSAKTSRKAVSLARRAWQRITEDL